jgi:cytoskeletal protein CcmA (bactofilin family)
MASDSLTPSDARYPAAGGSALIGKGVVIKGELDGSEDLTIEGQVEGKIELPDHVLTIGLNGRVKAHVFAKSVVVLGDLVGNINASEAVDVRESASVDGDIVAPRVAIAQGSHFRGNIDMQRTAAAQQARPAGQPDTAAPESPGLWRLPTNLGS